jgi:hypothetical protein
MERHTKAELGIGSRGESVDFVLRTFLTLILAQTSPQKRAVDEKKPLRFPTVTPTEERGWVKKVELPLGEWEPWTFDLTKCWTLKCWPVFEAQVRTRRKAAGFEFMLNGSAVFGLRDTLEEAQAAVEQEIVSRVRAMRPAYEVIADRVMDRDTLGARGDGGCTKITVPPARDVQKLVDDYNAVMKARRGDG